MKRLLLAALAVALVTPLVGCGGGEGTTKPGTFAPPPDPKDKSMKGDSAPGPP